VRSYVIEIHSVRQLLKLARELLSLKERAPRSLRMLVAVTLEREVDMRPMEDGDGLDHFWDGMEAINREG